LQECKRQLAMAEKDVFDIQTNPYFLSLDSIDELGMEIEELKVSVNNHNIPYVINYPLY